MESYNEDTDYSFVTGLISSVCGMVGFYLFLLFFEDFPWWLIYLISWFCSLGLSVSTLYLLINIGYF